MTVSATVAAFLIPLRILVYVPTALFLLLFAYREWRALEAMKDALDFGQPARSGFTSMFRNVLKEYEAAHPSDPLIADCKRNLKLRLIFAGLFIAEIFILQSL